MRRGDRHRRGSAFVEFALSAMLMFTLCGGVFQFGYSMYVYAQLTSAVRAAARHAAVRSYDSTTATPSSAYATAVKNVAVFGSPTQTTATRAVRGLTPANVRISVTMNGGVARQVEVSIINFQVDAIFGSITFNGKPSSTFPYNG